MLQISLAVGSDPQQCSERMYSYEFTVKSNPMCVVFAIANRTEKSLENIIIQNLSDLVLTSKSIETLSIHKNKGSNEVSVL